MWRPLQLLKKWENSKRGIITGSIGCQNSPICHVKVCYEYISQASPPIDYPTKNCSRQQQGDKFFSLFVYITCYFVIDHLNVIGWLNVDHSVFQKEELWLALIYVCSNCIPFYIIYVSLARGGHMKKYQLFLLQSKRLMSRGRIHDKSVLQWNLAMPHKRWS